MSASGDYMTSIASLATSMAAENISTGIGVAVLKQIQDTTQQQAQALIEMMGVRPSLSGTGSIVNVAA